MGCTQSCSASYDAIALPKKQDFSTEPLQTVKFSPELYGLGETKNAGAALSSEVLRCNETNGSNGTSANSELSASAVHDTIKTEGDAGISAAPTQDAPGPGRTLIDGPFTNSTSSTDNRSTVEVVATKCAAALSPTNMATLEVVTSIELGPHRRCISLSDITLIPKPMSSSFSGFSLQPMFPNPNTYYIYSSRGDDGELTPISENSSKEHSTRSHGYHVRCEYRKYAAHTRLPFSQKALNTLSDTKHLVTFRDIIRLKNEAAIATDRGLALEVSDDSEYESAGLPDDDAGTLLSEQSTVSSQYTADLSIGMASDAHARLGSQETVNIGSGSMHMYASNGHEDGTTCRNDSGPTNGLCPAESTPSGLEPMGMQGVISPSPHSSSSSPPQGASAVKQKVGPRMRRKVAIQLSGRDGHPMLNRGGSRSRYTSGGGSGNSLFSAMLGASMARRVDHEE